MRRTHPPQKSVRPSWLVRFDPEANRNMPPREAATTTRIRTRRNPVQPVPQPAPAFKRCQNRNQYRS